MLQLLKDHLLPSLQKSLAACFLKNFILMFIRLFVIFEIKSKIKGGIAPSIILN